MNRNYKVIWNRSLNCFMAVAEYAKSRGKSSSHVVSSNATASAALSSGARLLRLSSLTVALAATGMMLSTQVFAETGTGGGTSDALSSTAISPSAVNCAPLGQATITGTTSINSTAIGCGTTITDAPDAVAIGRSNTITATNGTLQGITERRGGATRLYPTGATNYAGTAVAIGNTNSVGAGGGVALGNSNQVTGSFHGIALGQGNVASGGFGVGLGVGNLASGTSSVAVGTTNEATGNTAIALGRQTYSRADFGIAAGNIATVEAGATNGIALGTSANVAAAGVNSVAVGANANASITNSVALGAGSTTTAPTGNSFLTNVAAVPANGVVSVGNATVTRRIQNVAGGSAPTDAVNVAQLTVQNDLANKQGVDTAAALGGNSTYTASTGAISAPAYSVGGTTVNNVGAAITNIDGRTTTNTTNIAGNTSNITNLQNQTFRLRANTDPSTAVASGDTVTFLNGNNVNITRTGNNVTIGTSLTPTFTTITSTDAANVGGALTVTGIANLKGGADLNNQKILNVANGNVDANSQEAINGRQLLSTAEAVKNVIGGNAANTAGVVTATNIGGTGANTIDGAITNVRDVATKAKTTVTEGANVTVTSTTNKDGSTNYSVRTNDDLALTSVTAGNSVLNNSGVTVMSGTNATTVTVTGTNVIDGTNTSNYNANGFSAVDGGNNTGNYSAGFMTLADSGGNVNMNLSTFNLMLDADGNSNKSTARTNTFSSGTNVTTTSASGTSVNDGTNTSNYSANGLTATDGTNTTTLNKTGLSFTGVDGATGPNITTAGIDSAGTKITGVAAGTATTDAVNFGQLTTTNTNVTNAQTTATTALTEAGKGFNISAAGGKADNVQLGETVDFTSTGKNLVVTSNGANGINYDLADNIAVNKVTAGSSTFNDSGVTVTDGKNGTVILGKNGLNNGDNRITNLANGVVASDAATFGQLTTTNAAVTDASNIASGNLAALGGNAAYDAANNTYTAPTYTLNNGNNNADTTDFNTVGGALSNLDGRTTTNTADIAKGIKINVNGGEKTYALGETIGITTNDTILATATKNGANFAVNPNLKLTSVTTGNTVTNNTGVRITNGTNVTAVTATGTNVTNGVNTSNYDANGLRATNGFGRTGNYNAGSMSLTDGINYNQTTADSNIISNNAGNTNISTAAGNTISSGTNNSNYDANGLRATDANSNSTLVNQAGLSFTNINGATGPSVTASGISAGNTKVTNIANGTAATDAVNKGQLDALGNVTAASLSPTASYNSLTGNIDNLVYTLDDGTNSNTTANYNNVGAALNNLDARTTTNTADIADLTTGKTGLVRQDNGTGSITVGAATAGTTVDFTNSTGDARTLSGIADGSIAENSKDAINGGQVNTLVNVVTDQIDATNANVTDNTNRSTGNLAALGGGAAYDAATNTYTAPTYTLNNGNNDANTTDFNTVGDALGNLDGRTTSNTTNIANVQAQANKGINVGNGDTSNNFALGDTINVTGDNNLTTRTTANGVQVRLNQQVDLNNSGSVNIGTRGLVGSSSVIDRNGLVAGTALNNTTVNSSGVSILGSTPQSVLARTNLTNNGLTIADGPSITRSGGINAANRKVINVSNGTNAGDAVNFGQLTTTNAAVTDNANRSTGNLAALGGGAAYDATTGTYTQPIYTLDDGTNTGTNVTANNVGGALDNLNTRTTTNTSNIANVQAQANKGFNISAAGGKANNVQLGETVDFTNTDNNLVVTNTGNTINYNLAEKINLGANGSVTTGNTVTNNDGVRIDDGNGNITTVTTAGTKVTDSFGNTGRYSARGTLLSDDSGNVNANSARGNAILDTQGNISLSGARGNILLDNAGNRTTTSASGTTVTDGNGNTSNYGANGLTATDAAGNSTLVNQAGLSFTDAQGDATGPSITATGINAGNSTISNVADGVAATDVATLGQLTAANKAADIKTNVLGTSTADNLGGGAKYNEVTGAVSAPIYELNNGNNNADTTVFNNVGSALSNLDTRATTNTSDIAKGINFGNGVTNNKFALGDTINVKGGDNLTSTTTADGVQVALNDQIDLGKNGSIRTGNTSVNNAGITILNGPVDTVVLGRNGLNNGGNRITNLAEGIAADDAATFGQVTSVNNKVNALGASTETNLGGGATYNTKTGAVSAPTYTLDSGANTGTTADFNNVGSALKNLDGRTTTNTSNIADLTAGKIGLVRQDNGTGVITVGATTGGTVVDFTNSTGASRQLTGVASAGDYTAAGNANNAVNAGDLNAAVGNIENTVTDKGLTFASDRGVNIKRKLGETLSITGGETDAAALASGKNIGVSTNATNDGLVVQLAKDIDLGAAGSIKTGNTITNNIGVTISDGANVTTVKAAGINVTDSTNTSNYGANGLTIAGGPSITTAGINAAGNKVSNIANGTDAGDAVNLGQLTAASASADAKTDALGASTANNLGGGAIYNTKTGTVSEPTYTLNDGTNTGTNTTVNNVGSALSNLDDRTTTNTADIAKGIKINVDGGERTYALGETIGITTDSNIITTATKDGVNIAINPELALTSVTTGNSMLSNTGLTIAGGPSITTAGINAAGNKVSNIANATAAGDAVNLGQLTAANASADAKTDALGASTANNLGGGAAYNTKNGSVSAPAYKLDDGSNTGTNTTVNNVGSALRNLDDRTTTNTGGIANVQAQANKGFNISAAGGKANNVQLGDTVDFTNTDGNLVATASGNGISYNLAENVNLGTNGNVTTGNTVTNNAGVRIDDGKNITAVTAAGTSVTNGSNTSNYGANGFTIVGGPSVTTAGINAGNRTITNLADGVAATDAATKGQVDAVSNGLINLTAGAVQYGRNNGNINYDNVVFAGTQAIIDQDEDGNDFVVSGGTRLSNVANGINAADAVNKGQLDSLIARNVTNVEVKDQNGNPITVNITDQVVNRNIDNGNMDSLFLTYNVAGQNVTDHLTISETVQKMNTEGVKFAHTNAVNAKGDLGVTNDSSAGGNNSTAIGVNAIVREGADSTIALGHNTEASANATNSVVIGKNSQVSGQSAIAIGDGAQARGNQSISIGTGNIVNGNNSGAFGDPSIINGNNSYSVGNNNTINSNDTFVFGNNITSTVEGSVVLGTGSAARTGAGVVGYLAAGNAAVRTTTSTTGSVAVGDAASGVYRQVTGVAAGTADSDAVNVSQLKAVSDTLRNNNTALSNTAVQYDKNADGTTNKGSITLGGGAAGTTITNVKAGNVSAGSTDAINGSQLHNLGSNVAGIIGGNATLDAAGNLTASNIGGTGKGNINDAIAAVNQGNAQANAGIQANSESIKANTGRLDAGLSFGADSGTAINKPIGDTTALKFEGGNNITTTTTSSGIKFDLNGNINVDNITASTVTTGNTTVNNSGVTIKDGPSMTTEGINAGNKTITGVADGIKVNDAVNLGQLTALDNKLSNSVNELGYKINEVEDDANAGISAAMAMSSLPQAYIPGKSMIGGGVATYNGQSAVAIGVSKVSDNGRWVIKANGTADTQGNAGGAIGAGFHF